MLWLLTSESECNIESFHNMVGDMERNECHNGFMLHNRFSLCEDMNFENYRYDGCVCVCVCVCVCALMSSPNIESLAKHLDAVEVCDGSVHSIFISHLNQCCTRNTLHKFHLQPVNSCVIKVTYIMMEMFSPLITMFTV